MTPDKLTLTLPLLNGGSSKVLLTSFSPIFEYDKENRKWTDKQTGFSFEVVLPGGNYEKIKVRVPGNKIPGIRPEDLKEAIPCTFEGFEARFYKDFKSGEYRLTASANSIILVNDEDEDLLA